MEDVQEIGSIRFEALHSALSYALQRTLSKLTLKTFISCYPGIDQSSLEYVRKQIIKSWQTRAEIEFQKIFAERDLQSKLDQLDDIIQTAEELKQHNLQNSDETHILNVDISSLTPSELTKVHIYTEKEKSLDNLGNLLDTIRHSNQQLISRLNTIKHDISNDLDDFGYIVDDLKVLDDIDEEIEDASFKEIVEWAVNEIAKSN